jgi:single-strand DNA-binding protein
MLEVVRRPTRATSLVCPLVASGKAVAQFSLATNEYIGDGKERPEYHSVIAGDRLAQICGEFRGKGQQVAVEGRIQTRSWGDDAGRRHWKTEIVANRVELLSGRRKKDYDAESAASGVAGGEPEEVVAVA